MPGKELHECPVPDNKFSQHGCFYSFRGMDNKRFCDCPCIPTFLSRIKELEKENETLKYKIREFQSEV